MTSVHDATDSELDAKAPSPDAFQIAALLLAGDGMEASELTERLASLSDGDLEAGSAKLHELIQMGLMRYSASVGEEKVLILTEPGRDLVSSVLQGSANHVDEMEGLGQMRRDLLAAIAHEFRTPLTAVRTAVSLLQDPRLPHDSSQERRLLQAISQSAEIMQRLVTDFLDLARFQAGAIDLEVRRFEAHVLAREAVSSMAALFESRNQEVVQSPRRKRIWVEGDHRRLLQALINLLSNAHKFAPEDSTIYVTTERVADDVLWTVTDKGPGIPPEARERLFERYFSLQRQDSATWSGTGLGLPLALGTAQAHGGTVELASEPGQGSAFTLRIPITPRKRGQQS